MIAVVGVAGTLMFPSPGAGQNEHYHALTGDELGAVHFATSCSTAVGPRFNVGVALLHSFQYEQARRVFAAIGTEEPTCAMAQWGIAMSHYHGLWNNGDLAAGGVALGKARRVAAASPATTAREIAYINALAEIYRNDGTDQDARARAYERQMALLQAGQPGDTEAAIFHALALDVAAPKTDKTFANQRRCGEILEPLFRLQPHHPGIAHYLIHCYDNPVLAVRGLEAARAYARIAPASAHANHMPSHIFTRVGAWDASIASNIASERLAAQDERISLTGEARDERLHAMDYLTYAYLQRRNEREAAAVLAVTNALRPVRGTSPTADYALAAIPARLAIELANWDQASALTVNTDGVPWAQAITWTAIGIAGARGGRLDRAVGATDALTSIRDTLAQQHDTYWSSQVEVQRLEVAAWIAQSRGNTAGALATMRSAADLEESMDKSAVTPGPVTPAHEMLAELLLLDRRPKEALVEYRAVLTFSPRRFNAVTGAASAADAAGEPGTARRFRQELAAVCDQERPESTAAR